MPDTPTDVARDDHQVHPIESPTKFCLGCEYPLDGLPEPRCPECGRAFDPDDVASYLSKNYPLKSSNRLFDIAVVAVAMPACALFGPAVREAHALVLVFVCGGLCIQLGVLVATVLAVFFRGEGRYRNTWQTYAALILCAASLLIWAWVVFVLLPKWANC